MTTTIDTAFNSLSDLKLWYNTRSGISLKLSDVSAIIALRWTFFRDNWSFVLPTVVAKIKNYQYPDLLRSQLISLTDFIDVHRNNQNQNINPFSNSSIISNFYAVWENIEVSSLALTREESTLIQSTVQRVQLFVKTDFVKIRSNLVAARDQIADQTGTQDATYNFIYGRNSSAALRPIGTTDITNMQTLQNGIFSTDFILANLSSLNTVNIDPFALARSNANNPDINIPTGNSGHLVRMFFGDSLEDLAYRYLGDSNRWIEIAIANGLKPPYIDEIGSNVPLITNGNGNQVNISGLDAHGNENRPKLYINQVIFIQSSAVPFPDQRTVTNIRVIPVSGEIVITLDGKPNLNQYTLAANANLLVFLPSTINSNFMVLIPSPDAVNTVNNNDVPFFLRTAAEDAKLAAVDLAVNRNFDLVFGSSDDLQLSFSLANAIQAVQLKMISEEGQNPRHPNYGLPNVVGFKGNKPAQIRQALVTGITDLIAEDPRFDRVENLNVSIAKGTVNIVLVVRMAGSGSLVPISFTINTG